MAGEWGGRLREWSMGPWDRPLREVIEEGVPDGAIYAYARSDFLRDLRDILHGECPICAGPLRPAEDGRKDCYICYKDSYTSIGREAAKHFFKVYKPEFEQWPGAAAGAIDVARHLKKLWS